MDSEPAAHRNAPAGQTVQASLSQLIEHVAVYDSRIRRRERGGVHRMRVTLRRVRSLLATFGPLFDAAAVEPIRDQLRWVAGELGGARDSEVVRQRLASLIGKESAQHRSTHLAARIERELSATEGAGVETAIAALDSDRYAQLMIDLSDFATDPPWSEEADRTADDALRAWVFRDWKRLRRRVRLASQASQGQDRDAALHEVRKAAKRLRYATQMLVPLYGDEAARLARGAKRLQSELGEIQDSVVAQGVLRTLGADDDTNAEDAFVLGSLHAHEQARSARAEARYVETWARMSRKKMRRWLR